LYLFGAFKSLVATLMCIFLIKSMAV